MDRPLVPFSLDRVVNAAAKTRDRLGRVTRALDAAAVFYAVAGDAAVAVWVSRVDEAAVRGAVDVDILLRREQFEEAKRALEGVGFVYRHTAGLDVFLDGPQGKGRDAVHIVFANEMVRPTEPLPNPDVADSEPAGEFRVLALDALVRNKLTAFRDKDRVHLRDLIEVGLIDPSWTEKLPPVLAVRLQSILDTPGG